MIPPRIALIGFMGSGKSTVGSLLAKRIGYGFIDLDDVVEKRAGMSIEDIFRTAGEDIFRSLESQCLSELGGKNGIVVATGGGTPLGTGNRDFFQRSAATFFLEVPFETALKRTGADGPVRPLLARGEESIRRLYESRLPVYRSLGRTIPTEGKTPMEIVGRIVDELSSTM
jgi:shikimate kinase